MSNQVPEIYQKLLTLEQETELLRDINRALREENVFLKASLEKTGSAQHGERQYHLLAHLILSSHVWNVLFVFRKHLLIFMCA